MCDGWENVGDIAARVVVAAAVVRATGVQRLPPFGASCEPRCRMEIGAGSDGEESPPPAVAGRRRLMNARVQLEYEGEADTHRSHASPEPVETAGSYNEVFAVAGRSREANPWRNVGTSVLKLVKVRAAPGVGTAREVRDSYRPRESGPPIRPVIRANL